MVTPRLRGLLLAMVGLLICPAVTLAAPVGECQASTTNQVETSQCLRDALGSAEGVLGLALERAQTEADSIDQVTGRPLARLALDRSQDEWARFRDINCQVPGALAAGGSGSGQFIIGCEIEMTRARTTELIMFAKDE
jgi:uncharacterized protein YecT (DUF1311 family)